MRHFPIFLDLDGQRVVVSGAGDCALAKLRLLLKTNAAITVFGTDPAPELAALAATGRIDLCLRALAPGDVAGAQLFYAATEDDAEDARTAALARAEGALVNIVDNLNDSAFITPAIVDRDPVTIAIGTEGAAPVLARAIKADLEARLPASLGLLTRIGQAFRPLAARLPMGRTRRAFWEGYFLDSGPRALARGGAAAAQAALHDALDQHLHGSPQPGRVTLVGAGPGDPDLLTLRARREISGADVILTDDLVSAPVLELARREALIEHVGKRGFAPSARQDDINARMIAHARTGAHVVRLKGGDPAILGRLDEGIDALDAAGIDWAIVPGITAASAAAAALGRSLTARGRNSALCILTARDLRGLAEHDWRALARPGATAAIYMGRAAAEFLRGRLLMHGAAGQTPLSLVVDASSPGQTVCATTLLGLPQAAAAAPAGPMIILLGLSPRAAQAALHDLPHPETLSTRAN